MDSVLERMLAVEKQADQLVQEADQEAEQIVSQARRDLAEQQQLWQQQTRDAVTALVASQVEAAEAHKQAMLAAAAPRIAQRRSQLQANTAAAVEAALSMLAFPAGRP